MSNRETNIGYRYHSYPPGRYAYCVSSCSPFQSWSECISCQWDNELGDCNHGCALSRSACEDSSRLKNMVQLRRNQNNVGYGLNMEDGDPPREVQGIIIYGTAKCSFVVRVCNTL